MDEISMRRSQQRSDSMQKLAARVAAVSDQLLDLQHDARDAGLVRVDRGIDAVRALLGELEQYLRDRR